jgi:cyclase
MRSDRGKLGVLGLFVFSIGGCEVAPSEPQAVVARDRDGLDADAARQDICLADPPVDVPTRQVIQINDHLTAFYDGRNTLRLSPDPNWVDDAANKLGVATYAIHQGHDAIVFDTFPTIDQARWERATLEGMGITHFTVVTSHWHNDHIAGNEVYQDSEIIMTARGLQFMTDLEADLEAGTTVFGPPAINPVILPTRTYVGSTVLDVGSIRLELHQINIHSPDETVIVLPGDRLLLSGDTTEDTETFMVELADLKIHADNLKQMKQWKDFDRILPNHGDPKRIAAGGYDKTFITATADYIENMIHGAKQRGFLDAPLEDFAGKALRRCEVRLFEPYREVHELNKAGVFPIWSKK